jgi:hypothetical protein
MELAHQALAKAGGQVITMLVRKKLRVQAVEEALADTQEALGHLEKVIKELGDENH